jgi:2-oxoglutarate dehydrogenase complex dehydrogenase (E1) component-like enzyme
VRGHEVANIDPLGINVRVNPEELDIKSYGFTEVTLCVCVCVCMYVTVTL